ncbi:hypothetical protein BOX15_Mlig014641g1, partial [Macrostomum lignano]
SMRVTAGVFLFRRLAGSAAGSSDPDQFEVLLLHSSMKKGRWTMPKGHLDTGESLLQCANRETLEESGLTVDKDYNVISEFEPVTFNFPASSNPSILKRVTIWIGEVKPDASPVKISHEHRDYRWCRHDECQALLTAGFPESVDTYLKMRDFINRK